MDYSHNKYVRVVDVGPRDGLQNESKILSTPVKVEYILRLLKAKVNSIEVTSFVRKEKIPQMGDALLLLDELAHRGKLENVSLTNKEFMALIPNLKGFEESRKSLQFPVRHLALFTATSQTFNQKNIHASIEESLKKIEEIIHFKNSLSDASEYTLRGYVSTAFGCPYEGETSVDQLLKLIDFFVKIGAKDISIGDTIGVATPKQVSKIIRQIKQHHDLSNITMHFHDTRGMALTNIYVSLDEGIRSFDSSSGGLGGCPYAKGATGNVGTEDVVYLLHSMGYETGIDLELLSQASHYIYEKLGKSSRESIQSKILQMLKYV